MTLMGLLNSISNNFIIAAIIGAICASVLIVILWKIYVVLIEIRDELRAKPKKIDYSA
ncbi:glycerol uptake facilitator-like aquaporin [Paenibacillus sp. V4I7]|nr:glycerol uptake facilitator-like aquaporin [Paenibacillus sp. V4I7]MDQ0913778.1 glycerol uptake facilitator-like aquaporin [Paenibacillus sp. V4I5]